VAEEGKFRDLKSTKTSKVHQTSQQKVWKGKKRTLLMEYILKQVSRERRLSGFPAAEVKLMDFRLPKMLSPTGPLPSDVRIGSDILHIRRILSAVCFSLIDILQIRLDPDTLISPLRGADFLLSQIPNFRSSSAKNPPLCQG
jgi:hypothetical protein